MNSVKRTGVLRKYLKIGLGLWVLYFISQLKMITMGTTEQNVCLFKEFHIRHFKHWLIMKIEKM